VERKSEEWNGGGLELLKVERDNAKRLQKTVGVPQTGKGCRGRLKRRNQGAAGGQTHKGGESKKGTLAIVKIRAPASEGDSPPGGKGRERKREVEKW